MSRIHRLVLWVAVVAAPVVFAGDAPPPPAWVEIEPNAIQRRDEPMRIEVGGLSPGERVVFAVLQDCDGDGQPGGDGDCPPLMERNSAKADARGIVSDGLVYGDLEAGEEFRIRQRGLWLRVQRPGGVGARWARFGYVENPCSLWSTIAESFLGGECDPGLAQALRQHRGPSTLEDALFEVRRIGLDPRNSKDQPLPIVGTLGATGVGWHGPFGLLFTIGPVAASSGGDELLGPGLYRLDMGDGEPTELWVPVDSYWPTAPHSLQDGRIAFARQRLGTPDDGSPAAYLSVLGPVGELVADHPIHRKIHQIVAHDAKGDSVLALTLGEADNRPAFLRIDLTSGEVHFVGYHHALYHASMRAPSSERSVIAFENTYGDFGWDLVLVDGHGRLIREVQVREGHDVLPAWRPTGGEVAYLAEVSGAVGEEDAP